MDEQKVYEIEIAGWTADDDVRTDGPLQTAVLRADEESTVLVVQADQSGLVGLLRHLHGRGAVLLSVRSARELPGRDA